MAQRKPISVKIATVKVIKALESALAKLEKDYSAQESLEAKHEKATEAYHKQLVELAIANIKESTKLSYKLSLMERNT
jgi:hypothetical protein